MTELETTISPVLSLRELAEYLDVSVDTVLKWWHSGKIPPPDKRVTRKKIYWSVETIRAWMRSK